MIGSSRNDKWHGRLIRYVPLVLCTAVIWMLSTGGASKMQTSLFILPVLQFLFEGAPEESIEQIHFWIRRSAHVIEYGVLGVLAARAFYYSSVRWISGYWPLSSIIAVAAVAVLDEFNQSFNSERTGSIWDVGLDCIGGLVGVMLYIMIHRIFAQTGNLASRQVKKV